MLSPAKEDAVVPYAALGVAILFWGSGFAPTEIALRSSSSTTLNVLRVLPAALLLLGVLWWAKRDAWKPDVLSIPTIVSGALMIGVFTAAISEGTARAGAANTAVILNTHAFWVLVLARVFLDERVRGWSIVGLLLGFAGVVTIVAPQLSNSSGAPASAFGFAAALGGALAWAAGTIVVRRTAARQRVDVLGMTAGQYVAGAILLIVLGLGRGVDADFSSASLWASVAWLVVATSALATLAFLYALQRLPAFNASAWQFLIPVVAIAIEAARGEVPERLVAVGMAMTTAGVCVVTFGGRRGEFARGTTARSLAT